MKELKNKIIEILEDDSLAPYTIEELQNIINCDILLLQQAIQQLKDECLYTLHLKLEYYHKLLPFQEQTEHEA